MSSTSTEELPKAAQHAQLLEDATQLTGKLQETIKYAREVEASRNDLERVKAALTQEKSALEKQVSDLQKAAERKAAEPAVIQKVAAVQDDVLEDTLTFLEGRALLDPDHRVKLANSIRQDPNVALRLARQVAEITSQPVADDGGRGISKNAFNRQPVGPDSTPSASVEDGGFGKAAGWLE